MARSGDRTQPSDSSRTASRTPSQTPDAAAQAAAPVYSAAEVLGRVIEEQRRAEAALQARFLEHGLVDQAVGVLVARLECGPKEAFDQLLELERRSGRDLLEVAGDLVGRQVDDRTRVPMDDAVPAYGRPGPVRLERAADGDELARLLLADTLAWSGAVEAAVALLQPDGALELIGSAGLPLRVVSQWQRIPPQLGCLLNAAVDRKSVV